MTAIGGAIAAATAAIGFLAAWVGYFKTLRPVVRKVSDFFDDWNGTPARSGVEARKGVMERLAFVEHELSHNSGESVKDYARAGAVAAEFANTRLDVLEAWAEKHGRVPHQRGPVD